jgi:hypothetical protein
MSSKDPLLSNIHGQTRHGTYSNVFSRDIRVSPNPFSNSRVIMEDGIDRNKYNKWSDNNKDPDKINPNKCNHEIIRSWQFDNGKWICDACEKDLTDQCFEEEQQHAENVKAWDAQIGYRCGYGDTTAETKENNKAKHQARYVHSKAIRVDALLQFTYEHDCWDWPTHRVNRDIIIPATRLTRSRYADLPEVSHCFGPAEVFISHCWAAKWGDLVCAACQGANKDRFVWIDMFAVRQWTGNIGDVKSFRGVIKLCRRLIVAVPTVEGLTVFLNTRNRETFMKTEEGQSARKKIAFFRLWCIVEIAEAVEQNLEITIMAGTSIQRNTNTWTFNVSGVKPMIANLSRMIEVSSCEAAVEADKKRELKYIAEHGGMERVNEYVRDIFMERTIVNERAVLAVTDSVRNHLLELTRRLESAESINSVKYLTMKVLYDAIFAEQVDTVRKVCVELFANHRDWLVTIIDQSFALPLISNCKRKNDLETRRIYLDMMKIVLDISETNAGVRVTLINVNIANNLSACDPVMKEFHDRYTIVYEDVKIKIGASVAGIGSALQGACSMQDIDMVNLLLRQSNINVNVPCFAFSTHPLWEVGPVRGRCNGSVNSDQHNEQSSRQKKQHDRKYISQLLKERGGTHFSWNTSSVSLVFLICSLVAICFLNHLYDTNILWLWLLINYIIPYICVTSLSILLGSLLYFGLMDEGTKLGTICLRESSFRWVLNKSVNLFLSIIVTGIFLIGILLAITCATRSDQRQDFGILTSLLFNKICPITNNATIVK